MGLREGATENYCLIGREFLSEWMKMLLRWTVVMAAQQCESCNATEMYT